MLFGNQTIANYTPSNVIVWMALAFQGGVLNIGGFLACHRFVSHVTGFATFFGAELSGHQYDRALGMLLVPFLFLCGAMVSGFLVDIPMKLQTKPKYYIVFGVLFVLVTVVVVGGFNKLFGTFGEPLNNFEDYVLLALLCLICGIQNATVTSVSRAVVRTTHLTGITTDLGIGIVRVLNKHRLKSESAEDVKANWMRLGIILFFICGSVAGGFLFRQAGYRGFLLPVVISGLLFAVTFYFQVLKQNRV
jgi:uncharacterized membrane protein YoaK (UPF0700 family)